MRVVSNRCQSENDPKRQETIKETAQISTVETAFIQVESKGASEPCPFTILCWLNETLDDGPATANLWRPSGSVVRWKCAGTHQRSERVEVPELVKSEFSSDTAQDDNGSTSRKSR